MMYIYRPSSILSEVLAGEQRPASTGNNRATCVTLLENVTCATLQRYGKVFHGQTLKSATSDHDQRHVIAFRPISAAARSCTIWQSTKGHEIWADT